MRCRYALRMPLRAASAPMICYMLMLRCAKRYCCLRFIITRRVLFCHIFRLPVAFFHYGAAAFALPRPALLCYVFRRLRAITNRLLAAADMMLLDIRCLFAVTAPR